MNNNIKVFIEKNPKRLDSFWYDGEIARIDYINKKVYFETTGEIEITINDKRYNGVDALNKAKELNYTDEDLSELNFILNNWIRAVEVDLNGETIRELEIFGSVDEVLDNIKTLEKKYKLLFWEVK